MSKLKWDQIGERWYETGVDRGVLYVRDNTGAYPVGVPWNGLTAVTESPSGAESNKQYADNQVYVNLKSTEEWSGTIEAFTYPDEFAQCDGSAEPAEGITIGQQDRKTFGFAYRTLIGNDVEGQSAGYKIHLVYGGDAAPSERANATVNDSPEAMGLSWEVSTTPVPVTGFKPTATLTIDSTKTDPEALAELEAVLWGTDADPTAEPPVVATVARLPLPDEILALVGTITP